MRTLADHSPELLSPNALFRPVVQDYLLPTLAYVGGSAEVAYFAQSAVVFDALLGRRTRVLPRISATLIEPKHKKFLEKYRLDLVQTFSGPKDLALELGRQEIPPEVQAVFGAALTDVERIERELIDVVRRVDSTLADSAKGVGYSMRNFVDRLNLRSARAEVRKNELISRHAEFLCGNLYPLGGLQERTLSGAEFVARHGFEWLASLTAALDADCPDHQVVTL